MHGQPSANHAVGAMAGRSARPTPNMPASLARFDSLWRVIGEHFRGARALELVALL
jgi:hypothetical protein